MDPAMGPSKSLTDEEKELLRRQDTRPVPGHKAASLEANARKHWDLFYKRNGARFFKDRHWTTREFRELLASPPAEEAALLEVGCGAGNFIYPLIEENAGFFIYACDLSPRAIELVKANALYDEAKVKAFATDISGPEIHSHVQTGGVDVVTMIFVLSAINPDKFRSVLDNVYRLLKPGGALLFRDYGLHDMAQLRFKPGHKIRENFYMRQDGTRSYFFAKDFAERLFTDAGFEIVENSYVHRRTVNKKENLDVPRIFLQSKLLKPEPGNG